MRGVEWRWLCALGAVLWVSLCVVDVALPDGRPRGWQPTPELPPSPPQPAALWRVCTTAVSILGVVYAKRISGWLACPGCASTCRALVPVSAAAPRVSPPLACVRARPVNVEAVRAKLEWLEGNLVAMRARRALAAATSPGATPGGLAGLVTSSPAFRQFVHAARNQPPHSPLTT